MENHDPKSPFDGFSKFNLEQRYECLTKNGFLSSEDINQLRNYGSISTAFSEHFIESSLGYYQMPLGIAVNFCIDNDDYVIPMAVEETSIIAAASKTAKWIKENGSIKTKSLGELAIGQIQIAKILHNVDAFKNAIDINKPALINAANSTISSSMLQRGGGVKDINLRIFQRDDGYAMAVIHIMVQTCDAMGANFINQICEYLREPIQAMTQEKVNLCILSNLNDRKLVQAEIVMKTIEPELAEAIVEASLFAELDAYRAATNNKGVMNGMDPVIIATGNDWRAVEAGVHAYAARDGKYQPITRWRQEGETLVGTLKAPINVGIVGGVTQNHPTAKLCLKMLKVKTADELSRVIAAVGLVQNLGALRALTTDGIVRGHMKLHITNLCLAAGATYAEIPKLKPQLEKLLAVKKRISPSDVVNLLQQLR